MFSHASSTIHGHPSVDWVWFNNAPYRNADMGSIVEYNLTYLRAQRDNG